MRETTKQIKFGPEGEERTYQIHKMNALAGSYLIKFCSEKLLPVYNSIQGVFSDTAVDVENMTDEEVKAAESEVAEKRLSSILTIIPKALENLSEKELLEFETRCLQTVDVLKAAGWQPVMINGHFGDEDLEYDIGAVLRLVYEVLVFNLGSFFAGGTLPSFLNGKTTSQPNV
ncbi:MAG: hypothetical protein J6S78_05990 [Lachnospiraceae bacterium]|nr:hypothetical protein [Lachnospiraceae bacterium]